MTRNSTHGREEVSVHSPSVIFGVTTGVVVRSFFDGLLSSLRAEGWTVSLLATSEARADEFAKSEGVDFLPIDTARDPSPLSDLKTLLLLVGILARRRPDIAVWGTPKIGLLGTLASRFCGVRCVYVPHGLRYQSESGAKKLILKGFESASARLANAVVTVGHEVRSAMIADRIASASKIRVLGSGSANGVPMPTKFQNAREHLGLRSGSFVVGFVGRVTRDKGVSELLRAWSKFRNDYPESTLLIAGMLEPDARSGLLNDQLKNTPGIRVLGHLDDLAYIYSAIDVLLLPSYREGLPTVVLEAGSYGVPCIVSDATGVSEPIVDGKTGLVVNAGSVEGILAALNKLARDCDLRIRMGNAAADHVRAHFDRDMVQSMWREFLRSEVQAASTGSKALSLFRPPEPYA